MLKSPTKAIDFSSLTVGLNTKSFPIPPPKREQFESLVEYIDAKNRWLNQQIEFNNSDARRGARANARAYSATVETNGKFAFDEILPGSYELVISGDPLRLTPLQLSLLEDSSIDVLIAEPGPGKPLAIELGTIEIDLDRH